MLHKRSLQSFCRLIPNAPLRHQTLFLFSPHTRSTRDSDADDEDEERRVSRGCTLQYQRALVKVLTQFHTTSTEGTDQVITMLGPDWQVDVTDLVQDSLKVADPRIAELVDRTILVGLELGSTVLKVNSPQLCLLTLELFSSLLL